jgi:hypothetical protein
METEETKINIKREEEEKSIWINVSFLNHRIRAKVFLGESLDALF